MILISFLFCVLAAYVAIEKHFSATNALLKLVLAVYFTMILSSLFFCAFLFAGIGFFVFETVLLLVPLAYLYVEIARKKYRFAATNFKTMSFSVLLVVLFGLGYFSYTFFMASARWGEWDAWAIWSQHAKFLLSATEFSNLFTDKIAWTHPDYPLLLPSLIAMFWKITYSAYVPAVLGYIFALLLVLMILASFLEKKYRILGLFLFLMLTTSPVLFPFVTMQCADTLIASFIIIPFVLLNHLPENKWWPYLFLIGFFAAACGWAKNEGLMFFVIFSVCFGIKYFRQKDFVKWFVIGTILPLLVLVIFKLNYATANDLVNGNDHGYADKLGDFSRYKLIFDYMYDYLSVNCSLLYYSLGCILLLRYRFYFSFGFIVILLLFASYFFAYVISPNDLNWHLSTSFSRLVHHIFPGLMYLGYFAIARKFSKKGIMAFSLKTSRKINT